MICYKIIFPALVLCLTYNTGHGQIQSTADELNMESKLIIKNKIKSVLEWEYDYLDGERTEKVGQKVNYYLFSMNGNLTERRRFTYGGNEGYYYFKWNFYYDTNNDLSKAFQIVSYDSSNVYCEEYRRDIKGMTSIIAHLYSPNDSSEYKLLEFYYDEKDRNYKIVRYESDSIIEFTQKNIFDKYDNKVQTITEWGEWKVEPQEEDTKGNSIGEENENQIDKNNYLKNDTDRTEGEVVYVFKKVRQDIPPSFHHWRYDRKMNLIESKSEDFKVAYKYNNKNQLVETKQSNVGEKVNYKNIFHYDISGNLIEMISYNKSGKPEMLHKFSYEFYE